MFTILGFIGIGITELAIIVLMLIAGIVALVVALTRRNK
jgi:hypothetical protein